MRCAWQEYLNLIPPGLRAEVDRQGRDSLQELRLRLGLPPELCKTDGSSLLKHLITAEDLNFVINSATRYSAWSASTAAQGYLTASGGHRVGLCGEAVIQQGRMTGIRKPSSVCIRVARDFPGIAKGIRAKGSVLILGKPGSGKTTLLRDLIRQRSETGSGSIAVVDERGELFPQNCFPAGSRTDVLTGCGKSQAIDSLLRTMGPECIAVDEITADEDCKALLQAGWCGVSLLATAHAASKRDLLRRPVYKPLVESCLFETLLIIRSDKSWSMERMEL